MILLSGITYAQKITIIILCISILAFTALNALLVVYLHRRNRKLNKRLPPPADTNTEEDKPNIKEHNI